MLTADRPGVFRGRVRNSDLWLVIDPEKPSELEQAWRDAFAPTNAGPVIGRLAKPLTWLSFIVISLAVVVGVTLLAQNEEYVAMAFLLLLGLLAGISAPIALYGWLSRSRVPLPGAMESVMALAPELSSWATDATSREALWAVNLAFTRARYVTLVVDSFDVPYPSHDGPPPTPSLDAVREHLAEVNREARQALDAVAAQHGFAFDSRALDVMLYD